LNHEVCEIGCFGCRGLGCIDALALAGLLPSSLPSPLLRIVLQQLRFELLERLLQRMRSR